MILVFLGEVILGFARQDLRNSGETWPFNSIISTRTVLLNIPSIVLIEQVKISIVGFSICIMHH